MIGELLPDDPAGVLVVKGLRYVTATAACRFLGEEVTADMVNKWHKRRKITGYRVGREVYFLLDELENVEAAVFRNPAGRPRGAT